MSGEVNEPLPRMSKKKAEEWARHFTDSMARSAGVKISQKTVNPTFHECVGKNDEVAEDGRFNLDYYSRAPLKVADHAESVKKIREDLKRNGYKIDGYQEIHGENPSVILDASDPDKGFSISVRGYHPDDELFFSISTPCLLPPGATQQQF
ncbi:hypothetical protein IQ279_15250 [Streptomyces verrucosisporus]|uniref:hypothetical protein n=1 Tax=Streptomyces verrucosisporus TaxID=1695161 RepID=UPI0019D311CD|nr:hypothetical protein [Streptomyces verrucosisporus]MBN3930970.1 hypothetical protein [Streptomyces verrucosisporus]